MLIRINRQFRDALAKLPPGEREVLFRWRVGFFYEDAAAICETAVGTIKSRVNRARRRLSELLAIDIADKFGPDPRRVLFRPRRARLSGRCGSLEGNGPNRPNGFIERRQGQHKCSTMCPMPDISCVICAYIEAPRIGAVLSAVVGHPLLKEIIVVDDGSTDATAAVVSRFPSITLLRQVENRGKSRALAAGVRAASGELILYLDADLKHLTPADISALAEPVLSGEADMSISIRKNSLPIYRAIGLDFVSGERLIPRSLLAAHFEEIEKLPPFGIETFMNGRIIAEKLRIRIVRLENVINTRKSEKMGALRGTLADWKMALDVLRVISPVEMIRQNYAMLALSRSARQGSR